MPDTQSSSTRPGCNSILLYHFHQARGPCARPLRGLEAARRAKADVMQVVPYPVLHMAPRRTSFDWQWTDKDKDFSTANGVWTPGNFAASTWTCRSASTSGLVNDPRPSMTRSRDLTV